MSRPCLSRREHRPVGRNAEALRKDWTKNYKFKKANSDGHLQKGDRTSDGRRRTKWDSTVYQSVQGSAIARQSRYTE